MPVCTANWQLYRVWLKIDCTRHAELLRRMPLPNWTMQPHEAQPASVSPKGGGLGGAQADSVTHSLPVQMGLLLGHWHRGMHFMEQVGSMSWQERVHSEPQAS